MPNEWPPDYPPALVYAAHATNTLGPPCHPKGWVLHTPEEPADGYPGTPYWFARPNVGGSTHYFVSYLGFVYQCVREDVAPIANGVLGKPYPAWANAAVSLNRQSLSVEIEGYAATIAQTISPAQKTALLDLIQHRCAAHGIPIDRPHIIGHYEVANNRSDPGTLNIDALVVQLQTPKPPAKEWDEMATKEEIRQVVREEIALTQKWTEWRNNIAGQQDRFVRATDTGAWYLTLKWLDGGKIKRSRHHITDKWTGLMEGINPDGSNIVGFTEAHLQRVYGTPGEPVPPLT